MNIIILKMLWTFPKSVQLCVTMFSVYFAKAQGEKNTKYVAF